MNDDSTRFVRKTDYCKETKDYAKELLATARKTDREVLLIPGTDCIHCYYAGYSFAEIRDGQIKRAFGDGYHKYFSNNEIAWETSMSEQYGNQLLDPEYLKVILDAVQQAQPGDYERHTQHPIAAQNLSFNPDCFSVCGFESAIPSTYFKGVNKPEIDLVAICPNQKKMLLIEFKCRESSLSGKRGISAHAHDYSAIVDMAATIGLIEQFTGAYNLMAELYTGSTSVLSTSDMKVEIAFLLTGSTVKDFLENEGGRLNKNKNYSGVKMLNNAVKAEKCKTGILWHWNEKWEDVKFLKDTFVPYIQYL